MMMIIKVRFIPSPFISTFIGFNNRARNPTNYGNNKIYPDSWKDALLKSFDAMPVTRWSTVHQNLFFINAWVR